MQSEMCFRKYSSAIYMGNVVERKETCSRDAGLSRSEQNEQSEQNETTGGGAAPTQQLRKGKRVVRAPRGRTNEIPHRGCHRGQTPGELGIVTFTGCLLGTKHCAEH